MRRLHVCVVTGTRAEFGIWRPVLGAIRGSEKLRLSLVVTGMHLQKGFGNTVKDIEAAGVEIAARVPMVKGEEAASRSLARGVEGLGKAYRELKPDLVMVLGDRLEMLAAASAALAERVAIGHVHGGETAPGVWDEQIRHAITKMAQVHFCATARARERILRMGEEPGRVHLAGAPALDVALRLIRNMAAMPPLPESGVSPLLLLHPSGPEEDVEYRRTRMLVRLLTRQFPTMRIQAIGPNNDPGHRGILRAYQKVGDELLLDMSMPQPGFWAMMMGCGLLVGNSSSGILEAASFGVPVVNIGERQAGRERNANVIDVPWSEMAIARGLRRATQDKAFLRRVARRENVYGDGKASGRIVKVLEKLAAEGGVGLVKRFRD